MNIFNDPFSFLKKIYEWSINLLVLLLALPVVGICDAAEAVPASIKTHAATERLQRINFEEISTYVDNEVGIPYAIVLRNGSVLRLPEVTNSQLEAAAKEMLAENSKAVAGLLANDVAYGGEKFKIVKKYQNEMLNPAFWSHIKKLSHANDSRQWVLSKSANKKSRVSLGGVTITPMAGPPLVDEEIIRQCQVEYGACMQSAKSGYETVQRICAWVGVVSEGAAAACNFENEKDYKEDQVACAGDLASCVYR